MYLCIYISGLYYIYICTFVNYTQVSVPLHRDPRKDRDPRKGLQKYTFIHRKKKVYINGLSGRDSNAEGLYRYHQH